MAMESSGLESPFDTTCTSRDVSAWGVLALFGHGTVMWLFTWFTQKYHGSGQVQIYHWFFNKLMTLPSGIILGTSATRIQGLGLINQERVSQQITTVAPQVPPSGWVLHGRVYDSQLQPVVGYSVFLVDAKKVYQASYGFSHTDSTGYFLLSYGGSAAGSVAQPTSAAEFFIEITNSRAQPVYWSTTAFLPILGKATYQTITLPSGEPV